MEVLEPPNLAVICHLVAEEAVLAEHHVHGATGRLESVHPRVGATCDQLAVLGRRRGGRDRAPHRRADAVAADDEVALDLAAVGEARDDGAGVLLHSHEALAEFHRDSLGERGFAKPLAERSALDRDDRLRV